MTSKRSNTASAKGRDIAPGVPAQKGKPVVEKVYNYRDGVPRGREFFSDATVEKFWSKVAIAAPDQCWIWQGDKIPKGYGIFNAAYTRLTAHRYVMHLMCERNLALREYACHSCDNPSCVNPAHLWLGTPQQNIIDMYKKGRGFRRARPTHCVRGHEYDSNNSVFDKRGWISCRRCRAEGPHGIRAKKECVA